MERCASFTTYRQQMRPYYSEGKIPTWKLLQNEDGTYVGVCKGAGAYQDNVAENGWLNTRRISIGYDVIQ